MTKGLPDTGEPHQEPGRGKACEPKRRMRKGK